MTTETEEPTPPHVPELFWEVRVMHPRESGKRTVYVQTFLVSAASPEDAQRKVALHRGLYYKGSKVGLGQPFTASEPVSVESHYTDRSLEGRFRGRLVSDILCEIAVEKETPR